jgi:hypothetical protein
MAELEMIVLLSWLASTATPPNELCSLGSGTTIAVNSFEHCIRRIGGRDYISSTKNVLDILIQRHSCVDDHVDQLVFFNWLLSTSLIN